MKKVLAFVLVLGMASVANAALTLVVSDTPNGPYDPAESSDIILQPTDTIWIGIHNDTADDQYQIGVAMVEDNYGAYNGSWTGNYVWNPNYTTADPQPRPAFFTSYVPPYNLAYIAVYNTAPGVESFPPGVGFGFEFHCDVIGPVIIQIWDLEAGGQVVDELIIHQIPEPMTMALLGLGGLGLLRRRR
jgi:hypothetical protein